jgi:large subunit ribosomal protein L13
MTIIIDATGLTLGRLSTNAAKHLLEGKEIAIINSEKAIISGKKSYIKEHYKEKRELGTYRKGPFYPRLPHQIVKRTIRGMLPYQKPHGRAAFKRLKCYAGVPDELKGKDTEKIIEAEKKPVEFMTVEELSRYLGANV